MINRDNVTRKKTVMKNVWRIREIFIMLALAFLVSIVIISCGGDSTDPVGPVDPGDPPISDFEWPKAPPEEHGLNPELLDTLTSRLYWGQYGRVTSLLIVRNGYLLYEEYFRGCDSSSMVDIYSCTKSITSGLIGIAIAEGSIGSVDDPLFEYLEGYDLFPHHGLDSVSRESITLENLLTMTAGFSWHEMDLPYDHELNSYRMMVNSNDWIQFTLDQTVVSTPGTTFEYNTGLSGLMAVVLENSTGQRVDDYAKEKLFRNIGIENCSWRMGPGNVPMTGSGIKLRPRDMAKFGWLYSQHGVWDGDTIVPSSWVEASCQPRVSLGDGRAYGYQWWMRAAAVDDGDLFYLPYALGYGGQHIFVPPFYDMVIVVTALDDQDVAGTYVGDILNLIGQALTP
jgi:CubicO group peptidase (beta-lactamase class C family)